MKKPLFIISFVISFLGVYSQKDSSLLINRGFYIASKLAYHQQKMAYAEAGLFLGIESHLSSWGSGWIYGPGISMELFLRSNDETRSSCIGPKVGFEIYNGDLMGFPLGTRCNFVYYTNGKENSLKLSPEIGFSLWSFVNIFYGYNIPLTNRSFIDNNGHKISLLLNIPMRWKQYHKS